MNPRNDQELLDQQADEEFNKQAHAAADYANYHIKRGTGTWRAWEHGGSFPGQGAFGLGRYYTDEKTPLPEKEQDK